MSRKSHPNNQGEWRSHVGIPVVSETDGDDALIPAREVLRVILEHSAVAKALALVQLGLASSARLENGHLRNI